MSIPRVVFRSHSGGWRIPAEMHDANGIRNAGRSFASSKRGNKIDAQFLRTSLSEYKR
jgi:hypothetical protein